MTPELEFIINPENPKYYDKFYVEAYKENGWIKGSNDFAVQQKSFGKDCFFVIAIDKKTKSHLGNVTGTFYRDNSGKRILFTIGSYFVFSEYRNKGIGLHLFNRLLEIPKQEGVNVYLNCQPHMKQKYCDIGLSIIRKDCLCTFEPTFKDFEVDQVFENKEITLIDAKEFKKWEKVKEFDQTIIGDINRLPYLQTRMTEPTSRGLIAIDKNDKVVGLINCYEAIECNLCFGPLYALSDKIAESLFTTLIKKLKNTDLEIENIEFATFKSNEFMTNLILKYTNNKVRYDYEMTSHFSRVEHEVKREYVYCFPDVGQSFA
uniref:N-acetyltransferase domain-containing protein n=1 Tax=Rhabditophanes sp. KR3021 TaxID=114890 RepID=A0AC35UFR1_9BILA